MIRSIQKIITFFVLISIVSSGLYFSTPQKAEAQVVPVFDKVQSAIAESNKLSNWSDFGQKLLEWAMDLATSFLRRALLSYIQDAVVSAIQGDGIPKFVVNWGDLYEEATAGIQDAFIKQIGLSDFCSPFSIEMQKILVKISLPNYTPETFKRGNYCTLKDIIGNSVNAFEDFREDFSKGSFIAFESATLPQNNFGLQIIRNQEELMEWEGRVKFDTWTETAIAGQGFRDTKECPDGPETCRSKTAAKTTGDLLSKSAGSDIDFILSSERLTEVLTSAVTLLVSTIIQEGLTTVGGLFNQADLDRSFADVKTINDRSFSAFQSSTSDGIDQALTSRGELNDMLTDDIIQMEDYRDYLDDALDEIDSDLAAKGAAGATQCGQAVFFAVLNQVNITNLKNSLTTELNKANSTLTTLYNQRFVNDQAISNISSVKAQINSLQNNTDGQSRLSQIRAQITADIDIGRIESDRLVADVNLNANREMINDKLNRSASGGDPGGFNTQMGKFRNCNSFS